MINNILTTTFCHYSLLCTLRNIVRLKEQRAFFFWIFDISDLSFLPFELKFKEKMIYSKICLKLIW